MSDDFEKTHVTALALHVSTQSDQEDQPGSWDDPAVALRLAEPVLAEKSRIPEHPKFGEDGRHTTPNTNSTPQQDNTAMNTTTPQAWHEIHPTTSRSRPVRSARRSTACGADRFASVRPFDGVAVAARPACQPAQGGNPCPRNPTTTPTT
ncbi:hypothetical protein [Streptomyces mobaraensis]|uniref:hypothetical protein n=1 Tax=Streptomyces mobaraensis TaxID=35621 RepID=UPI0013DE8964|nr:hypothetical protein [Streptomyces mobaraensis]